MKRELLPEFEKRIGYDFKNVDLLIMALTHSSYYNENRIKKYGYNERLEFLGDAVLELVASEYLYVKNPESPEGDLSKMRASYVCEPTLAECARSIDLGKFLLLGRGEELTGGRDRDSILSDALEATIGAVYLDGGFECAKEYICVHILNDIEIDGKKLFYDSKTILQEFVQSERLELEYELLEEAGPDHDKLFTVAVNINGRQVSKATGHTKKKAEKAAAYQAMLKLGAGGDRRF